ncbi:MAG TPA: type VI secretion system tip protein TssI/VgrG [Thermoanaerobaculia bacterium]|nr:type VI secretion system tip protein TssI/VgrG [Thermoanaerobaculia bacterium]
MPYTQDTASIAVSTPLGKDKLLLRAFQGEERISGLFRFSLQMESETRDLDFSKVVGKSATVTVELADGTQRFINGIVGRFVQAGGADRFAAYHAELVPALWLLTLAADCKIFQNKTAPEIVKSILSDMGITDVKDSLTKTYASREYCVQYNETAFAFISRLLEDEGIFYFFEHADGTHTLVLADDSGAATACPGGATVQLGSSENWEQQNVLTRCEIEQKVISGKFALDDFSFETPSTDLIASVDSTVATDGAKRRVFEYPGGYLKKDAGDARAKLRIEAEETPAKAMRGDGFCRAFVPGYKFTLKDHYRSDANADYVLTEVSHSATLESYSNSFAAIPLAVPFRPERTTPRPVIPGTQTALVVGKSGEEIYTDKYGRIKVQFHWDQVGTKDENSSCWVRVAQGWAGKAWGQIFIPRVGQEVVVSFLEGDPDRPLVTGGVYNAEQTVPYELPAQATRSTVKSNTSKGGAGSNELRFEDKKGEEEVYLHAQKDHNVAVENDETVTIKNNRTVTIQEKDESLTVAKGNRTVKVATGDETHQVKGKRALTATGDETHDNGAKFTHTTGGNYSLKVTGDLVIEATGAVTIKAGGDMTVEATGGLIEKGMNVSLEASESMTQKAGASFSVEGAMLEHKGKMAELSIAGVLTLKGGLVKIN